MDSDHNFLRRQATAMKLSSSYGHDDFEPAAQLIARVIAKAGIPNQLYGYLSKLAGPGATMLPSAALIPELQKLLDAEMEKHRARVAGSPADQRARGREGVFVGVGVLTRWGTEGGLHLGG